MTATVITKAPYIYYEDRSTTLWCGRAEEVLPTLTDIDLVIVDPPFGIRHRSGHGASWQNTEIANDLDTKVRDWIIKHTNHLPQAVFGTWKVARPACKQILIWDKGPAFGMGDLSFPWKNSFEEIYITGNGWQGTRDEAVLRGHLIVSWESKGRCHPNQKPVSLLSYLISKQPNAKVICDPCCGSGSTLIAARNMERRSIGIELSPEHCETAVSRLAQQTLFDALPVVPVKAAAQNGGLFSEDDE